MSETIFTILNKIREFLLKSAEADETAAALLTEVSSEMESLYHQQMEAEYQEEMERMITCPACLGRGSWEAECCNGSSGCSCRGQVVQMGTCLTCGGEGRCSPNADTLRNARSITTPYLGSGPRW
jgi:hypothetical protein